MTKSSGKRNFLAFIGVAALLGISIQVIFGGDQVDSGTIIARAYDYRAPAGEPRLISVTPLFEEGLDGEMCSWAPDEASTSTYGFLPARFGTVPQSSSNDEPLDISLNRPPTRVIKDPYPTFSAVAVDMKNNEIILQDENLFQIMAYDGDTNTPSTAALSEPKRVIGGHHTKIEFNCGLYVDPESGDIYSVNNDTIDTLVIFSREVRGDMPPTRELRTPPSHIRNRRERNNE